MAQSYDNLNFLKYKSTLEGFIEDMEMPIYAKKMMLEGILHKIEGDFNKIIQEENENFLIQEKGRAKAQDNQHRETSKTEPIK